MADGPVQDPLIGVRQQGVRAYNERLILSMIQRHGELPGSELARRAGLSPQTVSVILRALEAEGFVEKGTPQRGHVGKPRTPMRLRAEGAYSVGLKIGRRNAALVLADLTGATLEHRHLSYGYPVPEEVLSFLRDGLASFADRLGSAAERIAGIGIALPFQIWQWSEAIGARPADLLVWEDVDLRDEIAAFSDLPVYLENDATAACQAEHVLGRGREFRDYAYIYVGSFIGGGIVLGDKVFRGPTGNAGAIGPLPVVTAAGGEGQILDVASIYLLEAALREAGENPRRLWTEPDGWAAFDAHVEPWIAAAAPHLARAVTTLCAVIDFEAVLFDGAFPPEVRDRLVAATAAEMAARDTRGIAAPRVEAGSIGPHAREIGAATAPIFARYLLVSHDGLGAA